MNQKTFDRRTFLTSAALAGASSLLLPGTMRNALAAEPTLEETVAWLTEKIKVHARGDFRSSPQAERLDMAYWVESFNNGTLIVRQDTVYYDGGKVHFKSFYTYTAPVGDMNQTIFWSKEDTGDPFYHVGLGAKSKVVSMEGRTDSTYQPKPEKVTVLLVRVHDKDIAERMQKAFARLLELCKKAEAF